MNTKPLPFQAEDLRTIDRYGGRCLAGHDPGLGKTFLSLFWCAQLPEERLPAIVVCPASLKWHWERQAREHLGWSATVLETTKAKSLQGWTHRKVVIVNYDIIHKWLDQLVALRPKTLILDEAHFVGHLSRRHKACKELSLRSQAPYALLLTGTALRARPIELYNLLDFLRPREWGSRYQFGMAFCGAKRTPWAWDFSGASNLRTLHKRMVEGPGSCFLRRRKQDVLSQLPPKVNTIVPLDMEPESEYRKAVKDFLGWLREKSPHKANRAAHAEAIVKVGYLKRLAAKLKLNALCSWVDNYLFTTEDKLLIAAIHKEMITALRERYKSLCVVLDGGTRMHDRQLAVDKFVKDRGCRLFIGNITAAGTGWSAKGCPAVAFAELPWVPGDAIQMADRAHGLNRGVEGRHTEIFWLVARHSIEEKLAALLQDRQEIVARVLDNGDGEELNIYDELMKTILETGSNTDRTVARSKLALRE